MNCRSFPAGRQREKPCTNSPSAGAGCGHVVSQDIPRACSLHAPVNQVFSPAGSGFKGGCGVERSHGAARRAGLDFKSPRPISGAQAFVTFPEPRLNSGRRGAVRRLYPYSAKAAEQLHEHECSGDCREAGTGTDRPRQSWGPRSCGSWSSGGRSTGERDPRGPSGPTQPAALCAGTLFGQGRLRQVLRDLGR